MMTESLAKVLAAFPLDGTAVSCEQYGHGHINETYLTVTDCNNRYILQRINDTVFKDVDALIRNTRKANKRTQTEFADKIFISCQAKSKWEQGESIV